MRFSGPETFPDLTYTVQMRRRPLFYVFNMILPCFLITSVAFLGFCVPSDSGKTACAVRSLPDWREYLPQERKSPLAWPRSFQWPFFSWWSPTVCRPIPIPCLWLVRLDRNCHSKSPMIVLGVYYLAAIMIVSIATAMSVASLNLYHHGKYHMHPVPTWIARLFFFILPKLLFMNIDLPVRWRTTCPSDNDKESSSNHLSTSVSQGENASHHRLIRVNPHSTERDTATITTSLTCADHSHRCSLHTSVPLILRSYGSKGKEKSNSRTRLKSSVEYIHRLIEQNEHRCEQQEHQAIIGQEWHVLGRVVDRLLVFVFIVGTLLVFLIIFAQAPHLRLKWMDHDFSRRFKHRVGDDRVFTDEYLILVFIYQIPSERWKQLQNKKISSWSDYQWCK